MLDGSFNDPQEEKPVACCDVCRGEVYSGDLVHLINGFVVCPECFFDYTFDYFSDCLYLGSELKDTKEDLHNDA